MSDANVSTAIGTIATDKAHPPTSSYVGRFAPSPSGPLHFGSLVAAVASYLQARRANGRWLLRIEDLDTPRIDPGAVDSILRTLELLGFQWDGAEFQSRRLPLYVAAIESLDRRSLVYRCSCSRSQIAATEEQRYPGTCRLHPPSPGARTALRFQVDPGRVEFTDLLQGFQSIDVAHQCGDFVVRRRDGIFAYHLAVVVDDANQGVTEIVRGADLLESTPRHLLLQRALNLSTPSYCHVPLALDPSGQKLSKSLQALPIDSVHAVQALWQALTFLRQSPPVELKSYPLRSAWEWALGNWTLAPLRQVKSDAAC